MQSSRVGEPHIIWISGENWDQDGGTHREMAIALSAHSRILWVDPPSSPVSPHKKQRAVRPVLDQVTERMTRLSPVVLPGFTRPVVRLTTPALVRAQVRWAMHQLGCRPDVVVMLYLGGLLGGWGEGVTNVMYGTDDYVAGASLMGLSVTHLRRRERQALAKADIVVALSTELARRWLDMGANPVVIPNGCWPIADAASRPSVKETGLSRPVAGLLGRLSDRIDFDVLDAIADSGQSLILMGPRDPNWEPERFRELISKPSVRYIGPVPYTEVPDYLTAIDIGITPYRDTAFNRASFPLKTLEYLSAGIPVVTAGLPAMQWLRSDLEKSVSADIADQMLLLANGAQDYVSAIRALAACNGHAAGHCVAFADRHSWPRRAEQFATEIGLLPISPSADAS